MARPAPAASRALAIIDFLMSHSSERFSLTELARRTGMNGASAHAVAAVLQERGYVVRHPAQKVYSLGPAVISAGLAAMVQQPAIRYAIDEVERLSEVLDLEIFGTAVAGSDIICFARAGRPGPARDSMYVGQRVPFLPPLGALFVAWAGEEEIQTWLDRLAPLPVRGREATPRGTRWRPGAWLQPGQSGSLASSFQPCSSIARRPAGKRSTAQGAFRHHPRARS